MSRFFVEFKLCPCSQTADRIVYDGLDTLWEGRLYRESYAPDAFLRRAKPARFRLRHDSGTIGIVNVLVAHREWFHGTAVVEDGPLNKIARDRIKVGTKVSLGARSLQRYENPDLRLVRHELCELEEVALVGPDQVPGFIGAVVTHVREAPAPATTVVTRAETIQGNMVPSDQAFRRYAEKQAAKGILVRPGVGQILGVR